MELVDHGAADGVDEPLDEPAMEAAHDVGVRLGQLTERSMREGHRGLAVVVDHGGIEAEGVEPCDQGGDA